MSRPAVAKVILEFSAGPHDLLIRAAVRVAVAFQEAVSTPWVLFGPVVPARSVGA